MGLPNLILPGAQKSATTTLYRLLTRHPDIASGTPKEPHFFAKDDLYAQGVAAYANRFSSTNGERYVIDASQSYLPFGEVPDRIHETLGDGTRFVVLLRDPVRRIESAFKHFRVKDGGEMVRSLSDLYPSAREISRMELPTLMEYEAKEVARRLANGDIIGRHPSWTRKGFPFNYAAVSAYHAHIQRYIWTFGREQFLFIGFRTMTQDQNKALSQIAAFLGIDPAPMQVDQSVNATPQRYQSALARRVIEPAKKAIRPLLGSTLSTSLGKVERRLFKKHIKMEFEPDVRAALSGVFAEDMAAVSSLTGVSLEDL
ncbi:sulfotransferase family protein [Rubricoccus marinus]|uniref:Sulfotransferase domain-containing protein n=1 Tax=Rubricoccus marinus TaxID=716817 RepID=A0A259U1P9_9BACT|nr:sulfotransferase [Rubricoccus marinus]OZC03744.1 hypothetical protein BSZ36_12580 [Rubricoccus marinus]